MNYDSAAVYDIVRSSTLCDEEYSNAGELERRFVGWPLVRHRLGPVDCRPMAIGYRLLN